MEAVVSDEVLPAVGELVPVGLRVLLQVVEVFPFPGGEVELGGSPVEVVCKDVVRVFSGAHVLGVRKDDVPVSAGPFPGLFCRDDGLCRPDGILRGVQAPCLCHHRSEIQGGGRSLPDDEAFEVIGFGHDEAREALGGQLVIYPAILILHGLDPVELVEKLIPEVAAPVPALRNVQEGIGDRVLILLEQVKHLPGGKGCIDDVFPVVAGVIPSAGRIQGTFLATR